MDKSSFIKQTALDYDLPVSKVKEVYKEHKGIAFHAALEQLLLDRKTLNN